MKSPSLAMSIPYHEVELPHSSCAKGNPYQTPRGSDAHALEPLIDDKKHKIIKSVHPSPLSAYRGFFNSKPFSSVNDALKELGYDEISW